MAECIIDIQSITDLQELYGAGKPKHPLITVIDLGRSQIAHRQANAVYRLGFYSIFCKKFSGTLRYGRSYYDFNEGSLMFTAPGQVVSGTPGPLPDEGWALFFHADLINTSGLGRRISDYTFFNYEANEALHISEEEKQTLDACLENIRREYGQNIDKHSYLLIRNNLELLLNYCGRFYDRQFYTREKVNIDVVQQFEKSLQEYFTQETLIHAGLPSVGYFAKRMNLSASYLSDLLHRFTGKSTQEHIHLQLVDRAKSLLWSTQLPVSEIAYALGFEHPSHFTRLFKSKTGCSPREYRQLN